MTSRALPAPSRGVVAVPFGRELAVFDPRRIEVHVLNETAALAWQACEAQLDLDAAAAALAERSGAPAMQVADELGELVASLEARGLLGIDGAPPTVSVPADPPTGAPAVALAVLDEVVAVEAGHPDDRAAVADAFAHLRTTRAADRRLAVDRADGGWRLHGGGHDAAHPTLPGLLDALASQLNRVATEAASLLVLHAAALRSPTGPVVVLVGRSGAGKSTLAAALVAHGWDYLTDEAVGIEPGGGIVGYPKPLALDAGSRRLLGASEGPGELAAPEAVRAGASIVDRCEGPVALVAVVDRTAEGVGPALGPTEAIGELAGHSLNLVPAGARGLAALGGLALATPVRALGTNDLVSAVGALERAVRPEG